MKELLLVLALLVSASSFANENVRCDLNVSKKQIVEVTKKFSSTKRCFKGSGKWCFGGTPYKKALKQGYKNCKLVSIDRSGFDLTLDYNSKEITVLCSKNVMKKLSRKEIKSEKCSRLVNCINNETGNTSFLIDMYNNQCDSSF